MINLSLFKYKLTVKPFLLGCSVRTKAKKRKLLWYALMILFKFTANLIKCSVNYNAEARKNQCGTEKQLPYIF